ncbi:MAG: hypothetical protein ACT6FF_06470 [Methanosarcinaceae archaeon]
MKNVLIADNNSYYFGIMKQIFEENGYQVTQASTANESWGLVEKYGLGHFNLLVCGLKMRFQLEGLLLLFRLKKGGYKNPVYFASNGFNMKLNYFISSGFLKMLGIQRIIPKGVFHIMGRSTLERFFI